MTLPPPASAPAARRPLDCRGRALAFGGEPRLVGIVNVTDDSFYAGSRRPAAEAAAALGEQMAAEGAAALDVGGQSTRPGYLEISAAEEIARVRPVIERLVAATSLPVSIDTYKPEVARAALAAGAHFVNDIHGFHGDPALARVVAAAGCPVVLMHNDRSFPDAPGDVMENMRRYFARSLGLAAAAGVPEERIILDPGIGFAKTQAQNLEILGRLGELKALGLPLLLGASRKSVIDHVLRLPAEERLEGTLALSVLAARQRVDFLRVHDVRANLRAVRMAAAVLGAAPDS